MNESELKHLDISDLLSNNDVKITRVTESVEVNKNKATNDAADKIINDTDFATQIDNIDVNMALAESQFNTDLSKPIISESSEQFINDVLDKYNKQYGTNVQLGTIKDAIEIGIASNTMDKELLNAMMSNTITTMVNYTTFSMVVVLCQNLNTLVRDMLESPSLNNEMKLVIVDRLFGWVDRLNNIKSRFTESDIQSIVDRINSNKNINGENSKIVKKLIDLFRIN